MRLGIRDAIGSAVFGVRLPTQQNQPAAKEARPSLFLAWLYFALAPVPATAGTATTKVWLFDHAPSYPGVTMLKIAGRGRSIRGSITTTWYGPIPIQSARRSGNRLSFTLQNLNDPKHLTRRWTARFNGAQITLTGNMWYSRVVQSGQRGTVRQGEARAFRFAPQLPSLKLLADDGLARTPPMGWSSWNKFADRIDDKTIRAIADAMVSSGLRDAGYKFVNIDDGWQGRRDAAGVLHPNAKFPDMKALADYVHARGLKLGIYSSPGPKTCAGYAGSYGHVEQDARTFAAWGIDYLKYDLCSGEWFYDDPDSVKRAYYQMGAALRATGRLIVYSLCEYGRFDVADWGRSVGGHLWRTTGDITDTYATMSDIGFERNPKFPHRGPGGWNDPDMLEVGNGGMTPAEYRTHLTLWAMQAAPLMMGHDLRTMSAATRQLLEHRGVIAIDQDPLGEQGRPSRKQGSIEVWKKNLKNGRCAVAFFNRSAQLEKIVISPNDFQAQPEQSPVNLWTGDSINPQHPLTINPHDVILATLEATNC